MTAPRLSAYQAFIIAAGELFSVLTAAAASPPPPERFMAAVSDAVATIDRAHSSLLLVASQDALTAAAEVVQRAHRTREFLDPYQRSPHGLRVNARQGYPTKISPGLRGPLLGG